jgi:DNA-binding HxlR family transcriptional regulator
VTNSAWHHIDDEECRRFQSSVELVGKRWSSGILLSLVQGASRFTEILATVSGLSDRLLSQRLKELERAGLVDRDVIATTPVQVRYHLTERGADLMKSLQPLVTWGHRWGQTGSETSVITVHDTGGSSMLPEAAPTTSDALGRIPTRSGSASVFTA